MSCGHVYLSALEGGSPNEDYADFKQSYRDDALLDPESPFMQIASRRASLLRDRLHAVESVFEIGFGYGHFLHALKPTRFLAGIESSRESLRFATERLHLRGLAIGSAESVSFLGQDRFYDAVCAFHVIEHLRDPVSVLSRCRQGISPGGSLVAAVPVLDTLGADLIELFFLYKRWHLHTFTNETFQSMLARAGYAVRYVEREAPTSALKSSMLFIAAVKEFNTTSPHPTCAKKNLAELERFHRKINDGLSRLMAAFDKWFQKGSSVAIYGAGIHTVALIDLCKLPVENILCLIDDDPAKEGSTLMGIQVRSLSAAMASEPDIVLVSTLASEQKLLELLSSRAPNSTQVLGVYKDFFT